MNYQEVTTNLGIDRELCTYQKRIVGGYGDKFMTEPVTLPSRMLFRVAKAIAEAHGTADWPSHIEAARAAILAMREPTPDMIEAAIGPLPDLGFLEEDWRRMIDSAVGSVVEEHGG
jgi:hypothetical protein